MEEGDATSAYTVSLSGGIPTSDLTVDYATADGTATEGSDYTAKSGPLTFTPADYADKTFTVQTTQDILSEDSEDFTVTISNPSGGGGPTPSLDSSKTSVTTSITDNDRAVLSPSDPPSAIDIELSVDPDNVNEGDGETTFTVTATNKDGMTRSEAVTVQLALGGTAGSPDYTAPAQASVTIPANQASGSGTLTLTLIDDSLNEGDETIIVGGRSGDLVH